MIILDENILDGQRLLLEAWRLAARQIGVDLGRKGLKDEEIVVLLRQQRNPTFFTRDAGFYHPGLRHRSYCLVVASVGQHEVATFIRRFLRHHEFDTRAKRMGQVVRVSHVGLAIWHLRAQTETHTAWSRA
ncbi:MAG TPA: hypothetical protein VEU96_04875 [Bryobacteraceae bacterium]|nr:hypothetical protein [Bryobacteraceae bacterium]